MSSLRQMPDPPQCRALRPPARTRGPAASATAPPPTPPRPPAYRTELSPAPLTNDGDQRVGRRYEIKACRPRRVSLRRPVLGHERLTSARLDAGPRRLAERLEPLHD